jgi:hypothetical protein
MYLTKLFPTLTLDLQLFAEGGEGGTSGEGATGVTESAAETQTTGVTAPAAEDAKTVDLDAEFEALINGKYKDAYGKKTKGIVSERVKNLKAENADHTAKLDSHKAILEDIAFKYGLEADDLDGISKAIKADKTYEEQQAFNEGKTLDEWLAAKKESREKATQQKELATLRAQVQEQKNREAFMKQYAEWDEHTAAIKAIYPSYDLSTEMKSKDFVHLLRNGVNPKNAYELMHMNEILSTAMAHATTTTKTQVADSIIANGSRPAENGMNSQSAAITKINVSNLSKEQIADYKQRAARGEIITFAN